MVRTCRVQLHCRTVRRDLLRALLGTVTIDLSESWASGTLGHVAEYEWVIAGGLHEWSAIADCGRHVQCSFTKDPVDAGGRWWSARARVASSACHGGQQRAAEYLLNRGAKINWIGYDHLTPLGAARRTGAQDVVTWLIEHRAKMTEELC